MYLPELSTRNIQEAVSQLDLQPGESLFVLVGEAERERLPQLIDDLASTGASFQGGVFPGIIHRDRSYREGLLLKKLTVRGAPLFLPDMSDEAHVQTAVTALKDAQEEVGCFILVDGLSTHIEPMLGQLHSHLGGHVQFVGGGCGTLDLVQKPCIFTPDGIFQDAALLLPFTRKLSVGIRHGWQRVTGPLAATRSTGNRIIELNWLPAMEVYRAAIKADSGQVIDQAGFFDIAKSYPFGIFKEGSEDIVRDPISVGDSGDLVCVGQVPENTLLHILKGEPEQLIASARIATLDCLDMQTSWPIQDLVVFDCISRRLFLGADFDKELEAVRTVLQEQQIQVEPYGALSLGEISNRKETIIEFYNKTIVIGGIYSD